MKYKKEVYRSLALITQFGIHMLVPIFLCTFLGIFLDKIFHKSFLVIIFFFIGALAGFRNVFLSAKQIYEDTDVHHEEIPGVDGDERPDDGEETSGGK
ncbi:MAG TPA: AtpZ/AtpI family protein [Lachnospiraceae bacterium]|nr:AtpZ/AtpI family protein [Lachnospiraceae bacterium]